MLILKNRHFLSHFSFFVQVLRCFGVLGVFIVISLTLLLPIRFLTKVPSFVFRKLLHQRHRAGCPDFYKSWEECPF